MEEQPKIKLTDEQWAALYGPGETSDPIWHKARRRTLRDCFRAAIDALTASLRLTAAEAEHHISRIEAAAVDSFQTDMANITDSPEGRQKLRDAALALGQLGITGYSDVEKMVVSFYIMETYGITIEHIRALAKLKGTLDEMMGGKR